MGVSMKRCMGCMETIEDGADACLYCGYQKGTPQKEAYHMQPETILASRYIVGRMLGFGGFGVTYIGWDAQLERKVAIKEFLPSSFATRMPGYTEITVYGGEATLQFEAGLSRFTEEAKRLAGFNSVPGIVDIYDTFVENNTAYIAMQFLQGEDVKQRLAREGNFSFEEALPIIVSICETLAPVHKEGIIHRDIAPDNIYITKAGEVKLLDFGASRFATSVNSKSLSVILKSGYAPEEQYRSKGDQGSWSDVYALAATFYKMLTGVTPEDSMERAIKDELREPSQHGAVLPKDAENAIMNALNIRKENRTQTVEEFQKALTGDRVARVKEKGMRSDTGSLPLWGKIAIFGSLAVVLLFGLLTVTGVVDFGQGNLLADTFGSGVPKGQVNAPGVVNQMEEKAQKSVKKAGLAYLIVGTQYSDDIEKGRILSQEPLPGRLIEIGNELQVNISGGSRAEAMASGEMKLPDLTYMTVPQAIYQLNQAGYCADITYEYSDTVAEGLVMSYEEGGYITQLLVSVGKDNGEFPYGNLRAPSMYITWDKEVILSYGIASADLERDMSSQDARVLDQYYYSLDQGVTWNALHEDETHKAEGTENLYVRDTESLPKQERLIVDDIVSLSQSFYDEEIMFKVERWIEGEFFYRNDEAAPVESRIFEQKLTLVKEEAEAILEGMEELSWEEAGKRIGQNKYLQNADFGQTYEWWKKDKENISQIPFVLKGKFQQDNDYKLEFGEGDLHENIIPPPIRCAIEGELYLTSEIPLTKEEIILGIWKQGDGVVAENGDITLPLSPKKTVFLKKGVLQENITDKPLAAVLQELKVGFGNDTIQITHRYSTNIESGKVIWAGKHMRDVFITVSAGKESGDIKRAILVPIIETEKEKSIAVNFAIVRKNVKETDEVRLMASVDQKTTWEEVGRGPAYFEDMPIVQRRIYVTEYYFDKKKEWAGKTINLMVERIDENGQIMESHELTQTLSFEQMKDPWRVTEAKKLSMQEIKDYEKKRQITSANRNAYTSVFDKSLETGELSMYLLKGNFHKNKMYKLKAISGEYEWQMVFYCEEAGMLIVTVNEETTKEENVRIEGSWFSYDEKGNVKGEFYDAADILSFIR